jgi:FkbM family methyltransferase
MGTELIGNPAYGAWTTVTDGLDRNSIVYSLGVGEDVSWDVALIEKYGCNVYAFDPTPSSIQWIERQTLPEQFHFYPYGVLDFDGTAVFNAKGKQGNNNLSVNMFTGTALRLPVKRLATIMRELGHDHIDVLKMDIEGSEYAVIRDIRGIPVKQILVEMHNKTSKRMRYPLARARLFARGYREVARRDEDHTFTHI